MKHDSSYADARNKMVTKANDLIQKSRFSLTTQQQKIVLYLISQITQYDTDFRLYEFPITEFCRICGINTSGKNYNDLKDAIKQIADKSVWITLDNGKETLVRWIEKPYIDDGSGVIQIKLDKDMKPYLLQLKKNYTQYELIWTLRFNSKYSVRLYELIKSIHFQELRQYSREFGLDELKTMLDAETYKTYQHFTDRVLIPAVNEINSYSDKIVTFEPIKKGRSVSRIKFTIDTKTEMERVKLESELQREFGLDQMTLWDMLEERGQV